jgi:dolichyl-phosphate beta-glucosyltransferase
MSDHQETVCLIVPCFNEEARLDMDRFAAGPASCVFLFVNDGSTDGTAHAIRGRLSERVFLLDLPQNVGKAEAVRVGMLHATESPVFAGAVWIGYWDADLATPLTEVEYLLRFVHLLDEAVHSVWGSRVYRLGSRIQRSHPRHLAGRLVATVLGLFLGLPSYDSQCGAKLFRREVVRAAFTEPFTSRWLFDAELLMRLAEYRIVECPLREWRDIPGHPLRLVSMAYTILPDLIRIRKKYGSLK